MSTRVYLEGDSVPVTVEETATEVEQALVDPYARSAGFVELTVSDGRKVRVRRSSVALFLEESK